MGKNRTYYENLLKDFLADKYEKKHSFNNWYVFDENDVDYFVKEKYETEFEEYVNKKKFN